MKNLLFLGTMATGFIMSCAKDANTDVNALNQGKVDYVIVTDKKGNETMYKIQKGENLRPMIKGTYISHSTDVASGNVTVRCFSSNKCCYYCPD